MTRAPASTAAETGTWVAAACAADEGKSFADHVFHWALSCAGLASCETPYRMMETESPVASSSPLSWPPDVNAELMAAAVPDAPRRAPLAADATAVVVLAPAFAASSPSGRSDRDSVP